MSLSVLISEPDSSWAIELKEYLTKNSFEVDIVYTGKDCQLKVYRNKFLAVIIDIETKNHSALEVLKYLRLNAPSVKVILTVTNRKKLEELELSKDELRKIGASDILIKPYSLESLLESIEGANQFEAWKEVKASGTQRDEEEIEADDDDFTRIKIENFFSGNTTIFDHYIRLARNKYVKILHKGDFFEKSRLKKYAKEKEVTHLYFRTKERAAYVNFINQLMEKMNKSKVNNLEKKFKTAQTLAEKYIEEIHTVGLKPQLIEEGKKLCNNIYNMVRKDKALAKLLAHYEESDPPAYSHLFLVSFIASVTCQNLEWSTQRTVEMIAFGSFLHDIGMLKLPPDIKEIEQESMTVEQLIKFKQHPVLGFEMLQKYPLVPEPVRQITYQHHEFINGAGFPHGITGIKIYPLAKVVSLADGFADYISIKKTSPIAGLKELIQDRNEIAKYDPLIVKALAKSFIKEK